MRKKGPSKCRLSLLLTTQTSKKNQQQPLRRPQAPLRGLELLFFAGRCHNSGDDGRAVGPAAERLRLVPAGPGVSPAFLAAEAQQLFFFVSFFFVFVFLGLLLLHASPARRRLLLFPAAARRRRGPLQGPAPLRGEPRQFLTGSLLCRRRELESRGGGPEARPGRRRRRRAAPGEQAGSRADRRRAAAWRR